MKEQPSMRDPVVAIIVLSWNRIDDVLACLACIARLDYPAVEVIVVDNGSSDDSVERIGRAFPEVHLIESDRNLGYAGGVNLGLAEADRMRVDFAWLLNDDVRIDVDSLSRMVTYADAHPGIGLMSPLIYFDEARSELQFAGAWVDWPALIVHESRQRAIGPTWYADPSRDTVLTGAAMLVRMSVYRSIGRFDERFFAYYEDTDYSMRAAKAGYANGVVADCAVFHRSHRDADTRPPAFFYFMLRNELLFFRLHRRGRLGFGGMRRWLMTVLHWTAGCRDRQQSDNVEACVDGAWDAIRGRYGPRSGKKAPRWFRSLVAVHPYFFLLMLRAEIGTLSRRLVQRNGT